MKAVFFVLIITTIMVLGSYQEVSAEVIVDELIKIGPGRYWMPNNTRHLPVYVRTSGAVVGRNWWKVGWGWGSVVLIAGSVASDVYKDLTGESPIAALMDAIGIRWNGEQGQYHEGNILVPIPGGVYSQGIALIEAYMSANHPGKPYVMKHYYTYQDAMSAYNAYNKAGYAYLGEYFAGGSVTGQAYVRIGIMKTLSPYDAVLFCCPVGNATGVLQETPNWVNKTPQQLTTIINNYWNQPAQQTDLTKEAWEKLEEVITRALEGLADRGILSTTNPANGKTTQKNAEDATQTDINGETEPDAEGTGFLEQIYSLLKSFFNEGVDTPVIPEESDDTDTIIGQEGITSQVTAEKEKTEGFLDDLMDSVDGLRDTVNAKITALLGAGGACSAISGEVYGSTVSIDFCEIDWEPWRYLILALAALAACLIVLGIW